jgi:PilZ domain
MEARIPRPPRSPLAAIAEIVGSSGRSQTAQTLNLSVAGCYLETPDPFPVGSEIRLTLSFSESDIVVFGNVVRSEPGHGMGVKFRELEPGQIVLLKSWFFAVDRPDL